MRWSVLLQIWWKVNGNLTTWSDVVEQILASEKRNKSKRAGLWESQSGIRDRKNIAELTRSISSTRIGKSVLMVDVNSPKTTKLQDGLVKRTSSMLDEIESKTMQKDKEGDW